MADTPARSDLEVVSACVERTLGAPGVRVRYRYDLELPGTTDEDRRQAHGLRGLWRRGVASFFNLFMHSTYEGFAEPAAGRYMVEHRSYAQLFADGRLYRGRTGRPLTALTPDLPGDADVHRNLFWPLWALSGATRARFDGPEMPGRRYVVQTDLELASAARHVAGDWPVLFVKDPPPPHPPTFTVWTDGQYVRRVRFAKQSGNDITPDLDGYGALAQLELWDFGVPVAHLDWSRLPDFTEAPARRNQHGQPRQQPPGTAAGPRLTGRQEGTREDHVRDRPDRRSSGDRVGGPDRPEPLPGLEPAVP